MKMTKLILLCCLPIFFTTACRKKENRTTGVCYCDYASGDKRQFDLTALNRTQQIDSCNVLDNNAGPFGGECELE